MTPKASTIMVRTSERQSFLTCRHQWYWGWVKKYRTTTPDPKLVFGDLVHRALARYYIPGRVRGVHPAETFEQLIEKLSTGQDSMLWSDDRYLDMADLGIPMLERYVEHWREQDKAYEIISSEQTFSVPIGRIKGQRIVYVGTVDGVWRDLALNKLQFLETKTTTEIKQDALPMDEQIGAYWAYAPRWLKLQGILPPGETIDGILYNWLRKSVPNPDDTYDEGGRKLNKNGSISKRQPAPYFLRTKTHRGSVETDRVKHRVKCEIRDMLQARADPDNYVYKNPGPQFRPNCQFCGFRDPCELHETGNDWRPYIESAFKVWEPYTDHERTERQ